MVYVFLADGFETVEALCPVDVMRRAGLCVKTVSLNKNKYVKSRQDVTVVADIYIEEIKNLEEVELLMLPGGMPGTLNLKNCKYLLRLLKEAASCGIKLAAICAAPSVLGALGLLEGKEAVCFPGFEGELKGAKISAKKVVVDGNFITGAGMGVALDFGLAIVEVLLSKEKAKEIKSSVLAD